MAKLAEGNRFTSRWATMDTATLASRAQDVASALAAKAREATQSLASAAEDTRPRGRAAALVAKGVQSAGAYMSEQSLRDRGRDALALLRRHPFQAILLGAGATYLASRRAGRPRTRASSQTTLREVMTANVEVVRPDAPLQEAAAKMGELDVGAIPICDGERLVGMLTDRDITVRAVARGADPATTKVRDVMTTSVHFAFEDEPMQHAVDTMQRRRIRRLPVVDRQKRPVGIVSLADLAVDASPSDAGAVLHSVSEPARPKR